MRDCIILKGGKALIPGAKVQDSFGTPYKSVINEVLKPVHMFKVLTKIKLVPPFYLKKYTRYKSPVAIKFLFK